VATKLGFDNEKYLSEQKAAIFDRVERFGNKLYWNLEESCCTISTPPGAAGFARRESPAPAAPW